MSAMFRAKRGSFSLIQRLSFNLLEAKSFHLTSRSLVRKSNRGSSVLVKKQHFDGESHFYPESNTITNFYGVESDEGVIYPERRKDENKTLISSFQTNNFNEKKLKSVRFGTVRLDSDNKPQFHGQYEASEIDDDINSLQSNQSLHLQKTFNSENAYETQFPIQRTSQSFNGRKVISDTNAYTNNTKENQDELSQDNPINSFIDEAYFNRKVSDGMFRDKSNLQPAKKTIGYSSKNLQSDVDYAESKSSFEDSPFYNTRNKTQETASRKANKTISSFIDDQYFDNNLLENKSNNTTVTTPSESDSTGKGSSFFDEHYFEDLIGKDLSYKQDPPVERTDSPKSLASHQSIETSEKAGFPERSDSNISPNHVKLLEIPHDTSYSQISQNKEYSEEQTNLNSELASEIDNVHFTESRANISKVPNFKFSKDFHISKNTPTLLENQPMGVTKKQKTRTEHDQIKQNEKQAKADGTETAYDFVNKLRSESKLLRPRIKGGKILPSEEKFDFKGFRILSYQVPNLSYFTREEIMTVLKNNVLYSDDDIVVLNKPYNMVMHESQTTKDPCISQYLDELAREIDHQSEDPKLMTVHRLDKETCGCLLLARNEKAAQRLLTLFVQRKIIKTYWIVTINVPDPLEGVIDIPISEGSIDNKSRMVLHPNLPKDMNYANHSKHGKRAVTTYKTIATSGNAALVEVQPETGIKHQIRVHFGFGLSCPIMGDHKYSHLTKLAPQKLPSDLLQRLHVRQSKVRHIPMHIYARSIVIPQYRDGRNLYVQAPMPIHMSLNLQRLKFKKH